MDDDKLVEILDELNDLAEKFNLSCSYSVEFNVVTRLFNGDDLICEGTNIQCSNFANTHYLEHFSE